MKKIIRTLVLTMLIFVAFSAMCFASPGDNISVETVQKLSESFNAEKSIINIPNNTKDFTFITTDDNVTISGVVKGNDNITISLYTKIDEQYVPMGDSIYPKIGQLGVFSEDISLKYQTSDLPKESKISKNTLIRLELKRGESLIKDYRLIKITDKKDLEESLSTLKSTGFSTYAATKP